MTLAGAFAARAYATEGPVPMAGLGTRGDIAWKPLPDMPCRLPLPAQPFSARAP